MLKKAQIIMLPTRSNLEFPYIAQNVFNKQLTIVNSTFAINCELQPQHLYIISDDEIKEGDWYYNSRLKQIFQAIRNSGYSKKTDDYKIIATTDTSLNYETPFYGMDEDNNFPQPSQQFIEKYIESYNKGEVITDVLKVNPKDNTITIKKLKDSWNRQEVFALITTFNRANVDTPNVLKWIEENL